MCFLTCYFLYYWCSCPRARTLHHPEVCCTYSALPSSQYCKYCLVTVPWKKGSESLVLHVKVFDNDTSCILFLCWFVLCLCICIIGIDMQMSILSSLKRKTRVDIVQQNGKGTLLYNQMNHIVVVFSAFMQNKLSTVSANCTVNGVFASYVTATASKGEIRSKHISVVPIHDDMYAVW
jgi:hypothetical protein